MSAAIGTTQPRGRYDLFADGCVEARMHIFKHDLHQLTAQVRTDNLSIMVCLRNRVHQCFSELPLLRDELPILIIRESACHLLKSQLAKDVASFVTADLNLQLHPQMKGQCNSTAGACSNQSIMECHAVLKSLHLSALSFCDCHDTHILLKDSMSCNLFFIMWKHLDPRVCKM